MPIRVDSKNSLKSAEQKYGRMPRPASRRGFSSVRWQQSKNRIQATKDPLYRFVQHAGFEMFIAGVIIVNGIVMALEAQYHGFDLAMWTGHKSADGFSSDVWPYGDVVFKICDWVFGIIFALEISVRMVALRSEFPHDHWNWIDLSIVVLWMYSRFDVHWDMNAQMLRIARLSRLFRLVRLLRFVNSSRFDSLYLITTSLKGSVTILAWSFALLILFHVLLAMVVNQALVEWYFNERQAKEQIKVFEYFGSFSRSLFTMFELTLANWAIPARALMENVHEALSIYSVMHKMVLGFAVIGIVNAVFVQETFKVATLDDAVMVRQMYRRERTHIAKMKRLFIEADADHDGTIDRDEWLRICEDEWVKVWLKSQDIDAQDPVELFNKLDDGSGMLTAETLIEGTARIKSEASPMAVVRLISEVRDSVIGIEGSLVPAGSSRS